MNQRISGLKPFSPYVLDIISAAGSDDVSLLSLGRRVCFDPVISGRLIEACSRASYAIQKKIESPFDAVKLLGARKVAEIVLATVLKEQLRGTVTSVYEYELWEHSLGVAYGVQALLRHMPSDVSLAEGFTGGLFHDLGKLLLHQAFPNLQDLCRIPIQGGPSGLAVEKHLTGCDHLDVCAGIMGQWSLPSVIVQGVLHHHDSERDEAPFLATLIRWAHTIMEVDAQKEAPPGEETVESDAASHSPPPLPFDERAIEQMRQAVERELEFISFFF